MNKETSLSVHFVKVEWCIMYVVNVLAVSAGKCLLIHQVLQDESRLATKGQTLWLFPLHGKN